MSSTCTLRANRLWALYSTQQPPHAITRTVTCSKAFKSLLSVTVRVSHAQGAQERAAQRQAQEVQPGIERACKRLQSTDLRLSCELMEIWPCAQTQTGSRFESAAAGAPGKDIGKAKAGERTLEVTALLAHRAHMLHQHRPLRKHRACLPCACAVSIWQHASGKHEVWTTCAGSVRGKRTPKGVYLPRKSDIGCAAVLSIEQRSSPHACHSAADMFSRISTLIRHLMGP